MAVYSIVVVKMCYDFCFLPVYLCTKKKKKSPVLHMMYCSHSVWDGGQSVETIPIFIFDLYSTDDNFLLCVYDDCRQ